ncbi:PaaI family thioesterase [Gordonibacter sp. 28C]|uniref:PaaI family thioesterase n=1 Tax=Gordonibacter sp. 28C TaxID=2078569 RepID=UPI000DF72DC9|nr:PaaI family thioesterase [Gordonibacter sp. 28C]RDB62594.1 PaaI family thioesterase [Gordonibacter sp. 28C]
MALTDLLGIEVASANDDRVEAVMPVTPDLHQPFGFLHGGATIALLETVASVGAERRADFDRERPFGVDVHVRHRKSAKHGVLRATAELDREEPSRAGGRKQFWNVAAVDEEGDVVSEGVIVTKIVSLERLAEKERERVAARPESA